MNNEIGNVISINNAEQISAMISMHVEMLLRAENIKKGTFERYYKMYENEHLSPEHQPLTYRQLSQY